MVISIVRTRVIYILQVHRIMNCEQPGYETARLMNAGRIDLSASGIYGRNMQGISLPRMVLDMDDGLL